MDNIDLKNGKPMMTSINSDDPTRLSNAKKIIREYGSDYNEKELNDFVEHNPEAQFIMAMEYINGWNDGVNTLVSKYFDNLNNINQ